MKKFNIKVDGVLHEVEVEEVGGATSSVMSAQPVAQKVESPSSKNNSVTVAKGAGSVVAPLQGTVQTIKVKVGDSVSAGDVVAVIEAMKMENDIPATVSGKILNVHVNVGAKVAAGDVLIDIG